MGQCWSHAKGRSNKVLPKAAAKKAAEEEAARAADKAAAKKAAEEAAAKKAAEEHAAKEAAAIKAAEEEAAKAAAKAAAAKAAEKDADLHLFLENNRNQRIEYLFKKLEVLSTLKEIRTARSWSYQDIVFRLIKNEPQYIETCARVVDKMIYMELILS